jgi:hypothetical protein
MSKPKIIYHEKVAIDISKIIAIRLLPKYAGDTKRIKIEFKARYEYVFNPNTKEFDKEEINDSTELKYDENEKAQKVLLEFMKIWQEYLDENP